MKFEKTKIINAIVKGNKSIKKGSDVKFILDYIEQRSINNIRKQIKNFEDKRDKEVNTLTKAYQNQTKQTFEQHMVEWRAIYNKYTPALEFCHISLNMIVPLELKPNLISKDAHIMTIAEFIENVESGGFIDSDGSGVYCVKNGDDVFETNISISPSDVKYRQFRTDCTHINWYNK